MKVLLVGYTIVIVVGLLQPHPWLHKCSRSRLFWGVRAFGRHGCPRRFRRQCRTTTPVIPSFATRTTTTTHGLVRPAGSVWHRTKIHTNSHHQSPLAELAVPIDTDTSDDASVYQTVVEPAAAAAATQPLVPPLDPNNTTTARTRIPELIEVAFVHACMVRTHH